MVMAIPFEILRDGSKIRKCMEVFAEKKMWVGVQRKKLPGVGKLSGGMFVKKYTAVYFPQFLHNKPAPP